MRLGEPSQLTYRSAHQGTSDPGGVQPAHQGSSDPGVDVRDRAIPHERGGQVRDLAFPNERGWSAIRAALQLDQRQPRLDRKLLLLLGLAALFIILFMTIDVNGHWDFALPRRGRKVVAMVLVGYAIAYSSVAFQTVTNNRILSLYLLIQTVIVFVFGALTLTLLDKNVHFVINVGGMILFAGLLYRWLFQREGRNLYFLVLVGVIFGTLFGSVTTFMQRLLDPNDFTVLQDRMFASFNGVDQELLAISVVGVALIGLYSRRFTADLDVISLGRDQAINLGVDHARIVNRCMVVIAVLVSIATALVGPITFFGLLVANLAYQFMQSYRHQYLLPAATLISIVALVGGQLLVERVFTFSTSLSVIINFIGGVYFIYLLLKEAKG
jgi:iron complex transport system permease protein